MSLNEGFRLAGLALEAEQAKRFADAVKNYGACIAVFRECAADPKYVHRYIYWHGVLAQ